MIRHGNSKIWHGSEHKTWHNYGNKYLWHSSERKTWQNYGSTVSNVMHPFNSIILEAYHTWLIVIQPRPLSPWKSFDIHLERLIARSNNTIGSWISGPAFLFCSAMSDKQNVHPKSLFLANLHSFHIRFDKSAWGGPFCCSPQSTSDGSSHPSSLDQLQPLEYNSSFGPIQNYNVPSKSSNFPSMT